MTVDMGAPIFAADKILTANEGVENIAVSGDDVYLELFDGGRLMIDGAAGKDFDFENDYATVTAQISDGDLTFDGRADYFYTTSKSGAKVEVSNEPYTAEVWLDNSKDAAFHGKILELDASGLDGDATLVGNENDNVITASQRNSSLWGGRTASNDTLIAGDGRDLFWYERGNGNDVIQGAGENDTVNLYGITLDMISTEATDSSVALKFSDGGSLTLDTNDGTTFKVGETSYVYDKSDSSWKTR